jgi:hypothetical protein
MFSGAPSRLFIQYHYDNGVAELMESWDKPDPHGQKLVERAWAAGLAPVSSAIWSRVLL